MLAKNSFPCISSGQCWVCAVSRAVEDPLWTIWYILCKGWKRSSLFTVCDKTHGFLMLSVFITNARNYHLECNWSAVTMVDTTHTSFALALAGSTHSMSYLHICYTNKIVCAEHQFLPAPWKTASHNCHFTLQIDVLPSRKCCLDTGEPESTATHRPISLSIRTCQGLSGPVLHFMVISSNKYFRPLWLWDFMAFKKLQWVWRHLYQTGWRQNFWRG